MQVDSEVSCLALPRSAGELAVQQNQEVQSCSFSRMPRGTKNTEITFITRDGELINISTRESDVEVEGGGKKKIRRQMKNIRRHI